VQRARRGRDGGWTIEHGENERMIHAGVVTAQWAMLDPWIRECSTILTPGVPMTPQ
jgi:hypothetical protein